MTIEQVRAAVDAETSEAGWWWLSFADPTRPTGTKFLGAAVVQGRGLASATVAATLLGINPGGQIVGVAIPDEHVPPTEFRNRLLTRAEAESL